MLSWLRERIPGLTHHSGFNPRLSVLRETSGVSDVDAESQTVAFQLEFPDMDTLHVWSVAKLVPMLEEYTADFGPMSLAFTSVMEILEI